MVKTFDKYTNDNFLDKLQITFDFIDTADVLIAMCDKNPAPWKLYQSPNDQTDSHLTQWNNALKDEKNKDNLNQQFVSIYEHLTGENVSGLMPGRGYPITAGGAYNINGYRVPENIPTGKSVCTEYWPITNSNLKILKENRFITVLESHENTNPLNTQADYLCKYRYPDLRDIDDKLKGYTQNFESITSTLREEIYSLLNRDISFIANNIGLKVKSPTLLKELKPHEFVHLIAGPREYQELQDEYKKPRIELIVIRKELAKNPDYSKLIKDFSRLNEQLLGKVLENVLNDKTLSSLERYQSLISLHPLKDMNGRCMRMLFQKESGKAMYMFNWDQDIFVTQKQFDEENRCYTHMIEALKQQYFKGIEQKHVPKYYDSPEFWTSALGIDQSFYNRNQLKQLMTVIQNTISSQEFKEAVRQKDYYCYMNKLMKQIYNFADFKIQSQRDVNGNTSLHIESGQKHGNIGKLLIKADQEGLNLQNLKNYYQQTPIHIAACNFNFDAIEKLLRHSKSLKVAKDRFNKDFYNNIMDNIQSSSKQEFKSFIKFSTNILIKEGHDIRQYKYSDDSNSTLANQLLKKERYEKCRTLIRRIPDFPLNIKNIESILQKNLSLKQLKELKKIFTISKNLENQDNYQKIFLMIEAKIISHSTKTNSAKVPVQSIKGAVKRQFGRKL